MPVEPTPSQWTLPQPDFTEAVGELVGVGADLEPGTLLTAYRSGLFPMPLPEELRVQASDLEPIGWWSPDPRGVLPLDGLHVSRSLRRACRDFEIRVDTAFDQVIDACASPDRPHGWIDNAIISAYRRLHEMGWVHSIEAWNVKDGTLAGGLYGVAVGGLFAGESMFHFQRDASKVALVGLVRLLNEKGYQLLDVQWRTDHLASLGVIDIRRVDYLSLLASACEASAEPLGPLRQPLRF